MVVIVVLLLDIKPTQQKLNKQSLAFGQCIIYFVTDVNILLGENLQDTHLFVQNFVNCVEISLSKINVLEVLVSSRLLPEI